MIPYRQLEHTADIGLEISGHTIEELFINGVKGLYHLILPELEVAETEIIPKCFHPTKLELSAGTKEDLLVQWLNEFIYKCYSEKKYPEEIKIDSITDKHLIAEIDWQMYSHVLPVEIEIKAATYHNVFMKKTGDIFQVKIIFDV
jgi:SHS2 domain-containing protein